MAPRLGIRDNCPLTRTVTASVADELTWGEGCSRGPRAPLSGQSKEFLIVWCEPRPELGFGTWCHRRASLTANMPGCDCSVLVTVDPSYVEPPFCHHPTEVVLRKVEETRDPIEFRGPSLFVEVFGADHVDLLGAKIEVISLQALGIEAPTQQGPGA